MGSTGVCLDVYMCEFGVCTCVCVCVCVCVLASGEVHRCVSECVCV